MAWPGGFPGYPGYNPYAAAGGMMPIAPPPPPPAPGTWRERDARAEIAIVVFLKR